MANYIPKAEQFDTLNSKLDAINENLKTRASFVEAVAKMENATEAAEEAATAANTAAAGVVSPTATVTKTGDTATITVTDKSGTTTAEVKDGSDATVTKENVVSALGYEPEKPEGEYELIETIELTEDTSEIIRTQEPDGTAYAFNAAMVTITYPAVLSRYDYCGFGGNWTRKASGACAAYQVARFVCCPQNGVWNMFGDYGGDGSQSVSCGQAAVNHIEYVNGDFSHVNYIRFYTGDGSGYPSGTTIKIYGIRIRA